MNPIRQPTHFERLLSLLTRVQPGEGRFVAALSMQAFSLMAAFYLVRPVREALILTEGGAIHRSWAVGAQALLLILIIPIYSAVTRRVDPSRLYQGVNIFFVLNLVAFFLLGQAGWQSGFAFFVWASLFGVMAVTQFWAFATDLCSVESGQRLFGVIAVGAAAGGWFGARLASALFDAVGPWGLMLVAAGAIGAAILLSRRARAVAPAAAPDVQPAACAVIPNETRAGRWLGGFRLIGKSGYLVGIAALVLLLNWINSTGDFVLSSWLVEVAGREAPDDKAAFIGRFMGEFCSSITLVAFLVQLLLVSRIIQVAGLARALMVTPIAFVAGYLLVGMMPLFMLLQSALVVQKSFDYSLLNTTRNALLLPASREVKYQAKTAIDTFFYRLGDLLSTASIFIGVRIFDDPRSQFLWLILVLSSVMTLVAWLVGREYARRAERARPAQAGVSLAGAGPQAVLVQ